MEDNIDRYSNKENTQENDEVYTISDNANCSTRIRKTVTDTPVPKEPKTVDPHASLPLRENNPNQNVNPKHIEKPLNPTKAPPSLSSPRQERRQPRLRATKRTHSSARHLDMLSSIATPRTRSSAAVDLNKVGSKPHPELIGFVSPQCRAFYRR